MGTPFFTSQVPSRFSNRPAKVSRGPVSMSSICRTRARAGWRRLWERKITTQPLRTEAPSVRGKVRPWFCLVVRQQRTTQAMRPAPATASMARPARFWAALASVNSSVLYKLMGPMSLFIAQIGADEKGPA